MLERGAWRGAALLAAGIACGLPSVAAAVAGGRKGLCATAAAAKGAPYLAVLTAFPGELAPLVAAAEIEAAVEVGGRQYYLGRLDGVRVILGFTGIGMVNARDVAGSVLTSFEVAGLVVSGVAGTAQRIGDVVLPTEWMEGDGGEVFPTNPVLFALARLSTGAVPPSLEKCATVRSRVVCLDYDPAVFLGGRGVSDDGGSGVAIPCSPGGGDIFGCELPPPMLAGRATVAAEPAEAPPDVEDMETAAVARVAAERRVPFLGVRAASDGDGDPLGERGWVAQFFDYYRLAAENAGAVTRAVVAELGELARDRSRRRTCRLLARRRWQRAAARLEARAAAARHPAPTGRD